MSAREGADGCPVSWCELPEGHPFEATPAGEPVRDHTKVIGSAGSGVGSAEPVAVDVVVEESMIGSVVFVAPPVVAVTVGCEVAWIGSDDADQLAALVREAAAVVRRSGVDR